MIAAASQPVHPLFARAQTTLIRWRDDPALFVAEALRARPDPWQAEALKAAVSRDRLAVRSGHAARGNLTRNTPPVHNRPVFL
jgi:hypothetical protein